MNFFKIITYAFAMSMPFSYLSYCMEVPLEQRKDTHKSVIDDKDVEIVESPYASIALVHEQLRARDARNRQQQHEYANLPKMPKEETIPTSSATTIDEDWEFLHSPVTTQEELVEPKTIQGYVKHPNIKTLKRKAAKVFSSAKTASKEQFDVAKRKTKQLTGELQEKLTEFQKKLKEFQKKAGTFSIHNLTGEDLIINLNSATEKNYNKTNIVVPSNSAIAFNKIPTDTVRLTISHKNPQPGIQRLSSWQISTNNPILIKKNDQNQFELETIQIIKE